MASRNYVYADGGATTKPDQNSITASVAESGKESHSVLAQTGLDKAALSTAIALYRQKNDSASRAELEKIIAAEPTNAEAFFYLGKIERREKHFEAAVADQEKATQLGPDRADYFIALGDAYGKLASESRSFTLAQQSCAALEHAVGLAPRSEEARAALIDFCRKAPSIVGGGMAKAYQQANELRAIDPPAGTRLLITLYADEGRDVEAFQAAAETLKDHPNDYGLLFAVGRLAATDGTRLDEGETDLRKCLNLPAASGFPDHGAAHFRLGEILEKEGKTAEARSQFQAAMADSPSNEEAKRALARLEQNSVAAPSR